MSELGGLAGPAGRLAAIAARIVTPRDRKEAWAWARHIRSGRRIIVQAGGGCKPTAQCRLLRVGRVHRRAWSLLSGETAAVCRRWGGYVGTLLSARLVGSRSLQSLSCSHGKVFDSVFIFFVSLSLFCIASDTFSSCARPLVFYLHVYYIFFFFSSVSLFFNLC